MSSSGYQYGVIATVWGSRLVPLLVLGTLTYYRRKVLREPLAFWVFSVLSFHGIAWFVGQFSKVWLLLQANRVDTPTYNDKVAFLVFLPLLLQFAIAAVISIGPISWLHRLLAKQAGGSQTPNTSFERTREG